jgi:hypothetical protein
MGPYIFKHIFLKLKLKCPLGKHPKPNLVFNLDMLNTLN